MRKKGVSLVVLMVTIIVIIILATSIVINLVNTNSIKRASESVFKSDIRGFADELSLSLANEYLNNKGEFDAKKVNSYNNEVWYGDKKQDKTVQDVITNSKNTDYVGKIFIEDGELVLDGFELTKEEVKWAKEINIPVSFEKGVEELVLTSDYTSVTVKVPVEKEEVIKEYEYTIYEIKEIDGKEEKNQVNTVTKKENETTFSGLAQNKLYEVNVKIRFNNEENKVIERTGRINTKGVEENVTFTQNPSAKKENGEINWTAGNVIVTISHKDIPEGYEIQYKLTDGMTQDWTSGEIVEIIENSTLVVGRLYNKTLDDEVSVNSHVVSNIDKENPTAPTSVSITVTENTVTATATASGSSDTLSGLSKYQYSLNNSTWQDSGTFSGIKSGTETTVYARAVDKVGNVSSSKSNKGTTTSIGQVEITQSPTEWTKGNVTVTITHAAVTGYTLQYKVGTGSWTTYSSAITIDTNSTTVYARMYNATLDDEGDSANTKTVSNIDKVAPTEPTSVSISVTENTVTATASGSSDTLSGLSKYQYSLNNSTWQDSGTFTGIKSGTETTIYARAVDKVGNVSGSISNKGTTTSIGQVTISQNPTAWTNGNVTVTLTHTAVSGYTLQYKIGSGNWTTYSSALTISANNTTVYARMYNSTLADEGNSANSKTISNIDKVVPTTPTSVSISVGTNTVTATATGSSDTLSGLAKYQYSLNNSTWQDSGTFSGIKSGTETTVYARAVDKVGNVSSSKSNKGTTTSIGQVTITQSPTAWTKETVQVGLSHEEVDGYILQYKLVKSDGTVLQDWTTYSSALTISTNNTTVYARMYNATLDDEGDSANSKTISNIDKVVPTTPTSVSLSKSGNTITATATGSTDTLSGFSKYQYSLNNGSWQDSGTFSELTYGSSYTIYARAVDKVGNVSSSKSNSITLDKLSGGVTLSATSGTICVLKSTTFTVSTNTSGGTLSVSSSNTSIATVSISGTTVTVTGTSTAGTATITVTSAATSTYNSSSATYAVTVAAHSATTGGSLKSSATCTAAAVYYHKCSRCGTELSSTYTSGSSLGHSLTSSYDIYQHYSYCTRCDQKFNVTDHSFSSSVCQESTCTTNGYTWFTCNCGYRFKMQDRPLAPHTYPSSWSYNTTQHYKNCTVCGTRLSTVDHSFTASVYQESTSTVHGYTKYSCSCGYAFLLQDRPLL